MPERLHFTRYGPLDVPGGEDLISRFIRRFGEWAYLESSFVRRQVPTGAAILDAGAFVGTFSLAMASRAPARLVAVEANPELLPLLRSNFERLGPPTYCVHHGVLSDRSGVQTVRTKSCPTNLGAQEFLPPNFDAVDDPQVRHELTLPAISLSDLRAKHGPFDLIKLDIEGAELAALQGDAEHLGKTLPTLWMECNEDPRVLALYAFIVLLGYEVHFFMYPSFNPDNFLNNEEPIFSLAYEAGLLATKVNEKPKSLSPLMQKAGCELISVRDIDHLRECLWLTPRWGKADWANYTRNQLLGFVSRLVRQHDFKNFL